MPPRRRDAGFSLVELLLTVALVAILARLAAPAYLGARRVVYNNVALSDLVSARTALQGDPTKVPSSGTVVTVGPGRLSAAPHVKVSRSVRLTVRRNSTTSSGEPRYTITASHSLGSATYTVTESGRITATGVKL